MPTHCMVDLETLGVGPDAAILSIGAVKFDPLDPRVELDSFHVVVDPATAIQLGATVDGATVMWWFAPQRADARQALLEMPQVDLHSALDGFLQWYGDEPLPTWGNGAALDIVVIRSAFELAGLECPWGYRQDRCFRTLRALVPEMVIEHMGTPHSALDDAVWQTRYLQNIAHHLQLHSL